MILRAEIFIKKKRKRYYEELIRVVWRNNADLRKQYLGPKSLTKKKDIIMKLLEVSCTIGPTWKMGCIPQIWMRWWLNARCHVGSYHLRIYNPKMYCPCRLLSNKAFRHLPNNFHNLNLFWYLVRGLSNLELFLSSWLLHSVQNLISK